MLNTCGLVFVAMNTTAHTYLIPASDCKMQRLMLYHCDLSKVAMLDGKKISNLNRPELSVRSASLSFQKKDMAKVMGNILAHGLRGKVGELLVFRVMRGKTFVSVAACKPDKIKETPQQRRTRDTFREASHRAKIMLQDPAKKQYYTERAKVLKLPNAYTAAVREVMQEANRTRERV